MIALSFALPEESKEIVQRLAQPRPCGGPASLPIIEGTLAGRAIVVVHSGMGTASAAARTAEFLELYKSRIPSAWIAAGFGGGLAPDLKIGDIVTAGNFSDPSLLASIASIPARTGSLVTATDVVETVDQKAALAGQSGAIVVDMETAAIHRLCSGRAIPMLAVRAISDTATENLPLASAVWFDQARQRPRPIALAGALLMHPGRIPPFVRFVRGIGQARARLTDFLVQVIGAIPD